jgi:hypothetical protein
MADLPTRRRRLPTRKTGFASFLSPSPAIIIKREYHRVSWLGIMAASHALRPIYTLFLQIPSSMPPVITHRHSLLHLYHKGDFYCQRDHTSPFKHHAYLPDKFLLLIISNQFWISVQMGHVNSQHKPCIFNCLHSQRCIFISHTVLWCDAYQCCSL